MTDENAETGRSLAAALFGTRKVDPDELLTDDERQERAFAADPLGNQPPMQEPEPASDPKHGNYVHREGNSPAAKPTDDPRETARALFG